MSGSSLRGRAAIVGAALAGLGEAPGRSSEDIAIEASVKALAEAGLTTRHVDAVFGSLPGNANPLSALLIAEMLGIQPRFTDNNRTGGSTFKNPPGNSAWKLVDAAGCRGLRVGGAQVSDMHCNFLINTGNATGHDIETLGETVRERVRANSGIDLHWEIKRIGVERS